jgi:hypothetical protein
LGSILKGRSKNNVGALDFNQSLIKALVNSEVRCNIVGGFDIRLLSHKETMLPCQDILTSPVWKETGLPN